jgi:ABC-type Mn2+/Zn2+ transport system permease subunit
VIAAFVGGVGVGMVLAAVSVWVVLRRMGGTWES